MNENQCQCDLGCELEIAFYNRVHRVFNPTATYCTVQMLQTLDLYVYWENKVHGISQNKLSWRYKTKLAK